MRLARQPCPGKNPPACLVLAVIEHTFYNLGVVAEAGSRYRADIMIPRDLADDKLVPFPIRLPEDLYEWLREAAHRRRMPMAELVREALRKYRESQDPQIDLWTSRDVGR
jgi:ribbon-helix-helix CopG family protein